jgi:hypothetical protein
MATATALAGTATAQAASSGRGEADLREIQSYRLTTKTLVQLNQVQENMYAALKANPDLNKRYADQKGDREDQAETLSEMAKRLDRIPEMRRAIVTAGLTPREYMLAMMALLQAGMSAALMDSPGVDQSKIALGVRANVAFVKAHKVEMDRMQARAKEIEQLAQPASAGDPSKQAPDTTSDAARRRVR